MFCSKAVRVIAMLCLFASSSHSLLAQLGSGGGVSGTAKAVDGSQLSGARITVSRSDGFSRTTVSADDGTFSFVDLPSGTYIRSRARRVVSRRLHSSPFLWPSAATRS